MKKRKKLIEVLVSIVVVIGLIIYCTFFFNAHNIRTRKETITSEKIDIKLDGCLIAYFSDLHYGKNIQDTDLIKLQNKITNANPNIVIFGGDLLSSNVNDIDALRKFLLNIDADHGKYAVLGDKDIGNQRTIDLLNECNFTIISNGNEKVYYNDTYLNLVGIDSLINGSPNIQEAYSGVNSNYYTFVISHCPDIVDKLVKEKTDYVLSAHSLGGPVYFPLVNFFYRPQGAQNYFKGKYRIDNITLDITNGVGTINKDIRLFADAEIVFYKLNSSY